MLLKLSPDNYPSILVFRKGMERVNLDPLALSRQGPVPGITMIYIPINYY
jgi:hypothetical protein